MSKSIRRNKKKLERKMRNKPNDYPNAEMNRDIPFEELNLKYLKNKHNLHDVFLINDTIYITTKNGEEFFIEKRWNDMIKDYVSVLYHKNTRINTNRYHRENKHFHCVLQIFVYAKHHENKPFDNKRTPQIRKMERMRDLFAMI